MGFVMSLVFILFASCSLYLGLFLYSKPERAIELQQGFYKNINWRMEPISIQREIKSTRFMGVFLMVVTVLMIAYVFVNGR
ncbi:MAG: hypothetical protein P9L88_01135 [Candidatus Tantalella remota]|nr:hypothetical protein [Candidatus Tantalella remota]